ncbi:hypothetical protein BDY19DRAFT_567191 [Irpex rosettiformis]|uniref:Uncharacterized protein n=1 Tax=Irpex rosettiformis TaxID=378272 RepID=A0ACB8UC27_9APHY|nr:hypothetical protein BDY19DRAFT_567191 [Irpex rosettiformis]
MAMSSPSSSSRVTRAARTYGRRNQVPSFVAENALAHTSTVDTSPTVSSNSPTNSVSLEDIPPSSDDVGFGDTFFNDDDSSHGESVGQADVDDDMENIAIPIKYVRHSIRDALAEIDKQFDNEDMDIESTDLRPPEMGGKSRLLSKGKTPISVSEDRFGIPAVSASKSHVERDSTSPLPVAQPYTNRTRYIDGSDNESAVECAQTSAHTSPEALHPINTPDTCSSPTPPTSQEMVPAPMKGKGKARECRSVEGNDSDDVLPTFLSDERQRKPRGSRTAKEKRVKAPSKKELLETTKATARIRAEQRPSLPRHENKLRISSLFEKISWVQPHSIISHV